MKYVTLCLAAIIGFLNSHSQDERVKLQNFGITLSVPVISHVGYYNHYFEKNTARTRYGGISGGFFYKLDNDKISLLGGTAIADYKKITDLSKEAYFGPVAHDVNVFFIDAAYHKRLVKMLYAFGGLNYSRYRYSFTPTDMSERVKHSDKTLGIIAGIEFEPIHFFSTTFSYRPAIIKFDKKAPYHFISFDIRFHIPFKKPHLKKRPSKR